VDSLRDRRRKDSDESDSDQPHDLAALKRARLQNPGTISMFGSFSERDGKGVDDDASANAEKIRKLFDLPSAEKIITGMKCQGSVLIVEFPAWLVKNVMIQGYMLLTERHICFFAPLPNTDVPPST
jgi:hypothetical protein